MAGRALIAVHAITLRVDGKDETIPPGSPLPEVDAAEEERLLGLGAARLADPGAAAAPAPAARRTRKPAVQTPAASGADAGADGAAAAGEDASTEGSAASGADSEGGEAA